MAELRIPVTILTGFLGSGKTTLLNRLLKLPQLADTAVIINEFGEVGIDHFLVEQAFEDAVLLKNGCVCCTIRGDIADTLDMLGERVASGSIPPFRRIAIETTGLADPAPVAHTLAAYRGKLVLRLDGIVTTLDTLLGARQFAVQPEIRRQVAFADRILLTKTDLASSTEQAEVERLARTVNAAAPITRLVDKKVDACYLFEIGPIALGPEEDRVLRWLAVDGPDDHSGQSHFHDPCHDHTGFHHDDEITSTVIHHDKPIAWSSLQLWLDSLLSTRGADVLRVKGIVHFVGSNRPWVLQGVQHVLHPLEPLPRPTTLPTQIVVIGRNLSAKGLHLSFATALTL